MIDKLFICYETLSRFQQDLSAGNIKSTSIVFIEETHQIYTNGTYYGEFDNSIGPNGGLSNDQHLILSSDQIKWLFTTFANLNGLQTPWVEYTISYTGDTDAFLVDWNAPQNTTVYGGSSFNALISAVDGYSIESVTYSMGGNSYTIEADQYGYWHVTISTITSNVEINVVTTNKPYTWSIKNYQSSQDEPNIVNTSISRSARFAEGDTFGVQISTVNGYEFTHVIAQMDGDTIYENENVSTSYTIPDTTVTGDIEVTYGRQYASYDVTLDEDENWTWYYDSAKQNPIPKVDDVIKIIHTYNSPTEFYIFGNNGYNVARVLVENSQLQNYVTYNPTTGKVTISSQCTNNITLSADSTVVPKIIYGKVPASITGFDATTFNNGGCKIADITSTDIENAINSEYLTVGVPDIDKISVSVNAYDYIICLINTSYINKSSKLWYPAVNQYAEYNFGLDGYQDNGISTITIDNEIYKVYAQFSLMSDTVQMSVKNTNDF